MGFRGSASRRRWALPLAGGTARDHFATMEVSPIAEFSSAHQDLYFTPAGKRREKD